MLLLNFTYGKREREKSERIEKVSPLKDRSAISPPHSRCFFLFVLWTLKQSEILSIQSRERGQISQLVTTTVYYVSVVKGKIAFVNKQNEILLT
jgi:hypothetical protein